MHILRFAFPVALLALAGPAPAAERRFTVTDFDRVVVDGPFQVELSTGKASSARANASADALDRLSISVQGRTLRVRTNSSAWGGNPDRATGPTRIILTTTTLQGAAVNGAGSLKIDKVQGLRTDLALSGSGSIGVAAASADTLQVGLLGSGTISLSGKTKTLRADIKGSGSLQAEGLNVSDAEIRSETAGLIKLGVNRTANITAAGSGNIEIIGAPACTVKSSGAGEVRCGKNR